MARVHLCNLMLQYGSSWDPVMDTILPASVAKCRGTGVATRAGVVRREPVPFLTATAARRCKRFMLIVGALAGMAVLNARISEAQTAEATLSAPEPEPEPEPFASGPSARAESGLQSGMWSCIGYGASSAPWTTASVALELSLDGRF